MSIKNLFFCFALLFPVLLFAQSGIVTQYVDPFFGTTSGEVFPGASLPFGIVKLSPDVKTGYRTSGYTINGEIGGFSHTHTSGTGGEARYGNIFVVPQPGNVDLRNYWATQKENEYAKPGFYSVLLSKGAGKVLCEVSSSNHVGIHRYTFNNKDNKELTDATLLIDVGHVIKNTGDKSGCDEGEVKIISDREIEGFGEYHGGW
ncbi:MAG: hypothetical protein PHO27_10530 [Sulfuricurvum sp.]|nr:hypothetical protein [Sulfuricurvum sp.]